MEHNAKTKGAIICMPFVETPKSYQQNGTTLDPTTLNGLVCIQLIWCLLSYMLAFSLFMLTNIWSLGGKKKNVLMVQNTIITRHIGQTADHHLPTLRCTFKGKISFSIHHNTPSLHISLSQSLITASIQQNLSSAKTASPISVPLL